MTVPEARRELRRAMALDGRGHEEEAIPHYRKALRLGLGAEDRRDALIGLASSYRNIGELKRARRTIEKARKDYKEDPAIEAFYALILHDLGENARALRILGQALLRTSTSGRLDGYKQPLSRKYNALTRKRR